MGAYRQVAENQGARSPRVLVLPLIGLPQLLGTLQMGLIQRPLLGLDDVPSCQNSRCMKMEVRRLPTNSFLAPFPMKGLVFSENKCSVKKTLNIFFKKYVSICFS